jgi:hypothetical protein
VAVKNLFKSVYKLRDQKHFWYAKSTPNEDWDEGHLLNYDPTPFAKNMKMRLTSSRIFLNFITSLKDNESGKITKSITKIVEETSIQYNPYGGEQENVTVSYFKVNCLNAMERIPIDPTDFQNYLTAINYLVKDMRGPENPKYIRPGTIEHCACSATYWKLPCGPTYYTQEGTQINSTVWNAIDDAYACKGYTESGEKLPTDIERLESKSGGVYKTNPLTKQECGCEESPQYLLDYRGQKTITTIRQAKSLDPISVSTINSVESAREFLLDFDNTYCFPEFHHYVPPDDTVTDWVDQSPNDDDYIPDPEDPSTDPHDLISHGCECDEWVCPEPKSIKDNFIKKSDGLIFRHIGEGEEENPHHPSGVYSLNYFGGLIINEYERGICFSNKTTPYPPDTYSYYLNKFQEEDKKYQNYYMNKFGCDPVVTGANLVGYNASDPVTHTSGHSYTWCSDENKNYIDPGLKDILDCDSDAISGHTIETLYFANSNYSQKYINGGDLSANYPITKNDEIAKLGTDVKIICDDGTILHDGLVDEITEGTGTSEPLTLYEFSVFYIVTDKNGNKSYSGRNITVVKNC